MQDNKHQAKQKSEELIPLAGSQDLLGLTDQLNKKDWLFKKSEDKGGMTEDQMFVALGNKIDLFAKMLQLHPIDKDRKFKRKMKAMSHDELKPGIMICPDAVECETMTCNPRSLLQMVWCSWSYTDKRHQIL